MSRMSNSLWGEEFDSNRAEQEKVRKSCTWLEIMVMWLNVPRPPCFKGIVMKKVLQSLENTGSSFWGKKRQTDFLRTFFTLLEIAAAT